MSLEANILDLSLSLNFIEKLSVLAQFCFFFFLILQCCHHWASARPLSACDYDRERTSETGNVQSVYV